MGCQLFKQRVQNKSILKSPLNLHHFHLTRGSKQLWHQPKRYKNSNTTLIFFGSVVHYPDLPPAKLHAYIFLREIRQYRMKKQVPKYIDVSRLEKYSYSQQFYIWHYALQIFIMAAKTVFQGFQRDGTLQLFRTMGQAKNLAKGRDSQNPGWDSGQNRTEQKRMFKNRKGRSKTEKDIL